MYLSNIINTIQTLEGYEGEITKTIGKIYNFTLDVIDCKMNRGTKLDNGTWTGLVARVMNKVNEQLIF